jgi:hypothetical protein
VGVGDPGEPEAHAQPRAATTSTAAIARTFVAPESEYLNHIIVVSEAKLWDHSESDKSGLR